MILTTLYPVHNWLQGSLDDYNQAVAKGQEAWKKWREVYYIIKKCGSAFYPLLGQICLSGHWDETEFSCMSTV